MYKVSRELGLRCREVDWEIRGAVVRFRHERFFGMIECNIVIVNFYRYI